jgi:hypothetical protein
MTMWFLAQSGEQMMAEDEGRANLKAWLFVGGLAIFALGFIGLIIRSAIRGAFTRVVPIRASTPTPRFDPVPQDIDAEIAASIGPSRWRVHGVVKATGNDIRMSVDAETEANAKAKAELRGIVVTSVERE